MKVGLIGMAAKPYHKGHDHLIRTAANHCDVVELYVSLIDRGKKNSGETPIKGSLMGEIWRDYIMPSLPPNVDTTLSPTSPVTLVFNSLQEYERDRTGIEEIIIWGGDDDIHNWKDEVLLKVTPTLVRDHILHKRTVPRIEVPISGREMREHLFHGRIETFVDNLPTHLQAHGTHIIDILLEKTSMP